MQLLVKLIMNALYGEFLRRDITESYQCKSEAWMLTEYDQRVIDYQKIIYGNFIVKMKDDEGLQDEVKKVNSLPLQLAVFILSNSKRIMNKFIHAIDGFYTDEVYYTDTDSLNIENKHRDKLKEKKTSSVRIYFKGKMITKMEVSSMLCFLRRKKNIV